MADVTASQLKWLLWLEDRGGEAILDRYSRVVAGGEVAPQGASPSFFRLMIAGHLVPTSPGHFGIPKD